MSEQDEAEKNSKMSRIILVGVIAVAIIIALFFLLRGNETRTSGGGENEKLGILDCVSTQPTNPFFSYDGTISPKHEVKVTFNGEKVDKISYNFYGNYRDNATAEHASAVLHADYNKYMGARGIYQEIFYPTFIASDSSLKINLYAEKRDIQSATSMFFFLSGEEVNNLDNYKKDDLTEIYESKGFSCTFHE